MTRPIGMCLVIAMFGVSAAQAEDWPQWMGPKRDGVWTETGLIQKFPADGPKVVWRVPVGGGYAGPAVANGKVYLTDYQTSDDTTPDAAKRSKLNGKERVLCYDSVTGKLLWKHEYDCPYHISYPAGPRATPTVHDGKVYTLGAEGNLLALDANTGKVLWSHDLKTEYKTEAPIWGFCGHPLIDGDKLICLVGGNGSVLVAFNKNDGKQIWKSLTASQSGYCPPTIIEAGGTRQLIIWHAEAIASVNPETGKKYWSVPLEPAYGMAIMAPRKFGDYLFAGGMENKSLLLKLTSEPGAEIVWKGNREIGLNPVNMTPFLADNMIYGVAREGQFCGVKIETGERAWETLEPLNGKKAPTATVFVVKNGERYVMFNEFGELIFAKLSPTGYTQISKAKILEPTGNAFGRPVVWSHPAFANKCVFARNDKELISVSLAAE